MLDIVRDHREQKSDALDMVERIPDSDIIVRPAIMSMVEPGDPNPAPAAARRGDYCLSLIKEQAKLFVLES